MLCIVYVSGSGLDSTFYFLILIMRVTVNSFPRAESMISPFENVNEAMVEPDTRGGLMIRE